MSDWIPGGNGTWTDPARWNGGVPSGVGETANFTFANQAGSSLVTIPDFATITLSNLNVTLTGSHGLTIAGPLNGPNVGVGHLIFDGGNTSAQVRIENTAFTGVFNMVSSGTFAIELATNTNFNVVNSGGYARINAPISGSGALFKTGAGTLLIENTNTFTGNVVIQGGILEAAHDGALGNGQVIISNLATLRADGLIDTTIATVANAVGNAGSARISAFDGQTMTLTGQLRHVAQGTLWFGNTGDTGTVVAACSAIAENAVTSSFRLGGGTLRMGNALSAQELLSFAGTGLLEIDAGATLDTGGFHTVLSNLDLDGGTLRSSSGTLSILVNDFLDGSFVHLGTLEGTAGADSFVANIAANWTWNQLNLVNWSANDSIVLNGSADANNIWGSAAAETINGFGGNDSLAGFGGEDLYDGGDGDDQVFIQASGTGSSAHGGNGVDSLNITGALALTAVSGFEQIWILGNGTLSLTNQQFTGGFTSNATLTGTGTVKIAMAAGELFFATGMTVAGGANITFNIAGSDGIEVIKCALGAANTINGGAETDQIRGGNLIDTINGEDGNDKLMGLSGADLLTGGAGADQFRYLFADDSGLGAAADQILDFVAGTDKLDFRVLDADLLTPGRQTLTFIDQAAFAVNGQAQVRWVDLGADLRVEVDLDGNGAADMHILLVGAGAQTLLANDFLF